MFFKNYTRKQWRRDPRDLDPSVCGRIPIRTNRDDRFLSRKFQALPAAGYTAMFEKMLAHPKIELRLRHRLPRSRARRLSYRHLIYTGTDRRILRPLASAPCPIARCASSRRRCAQEYFQPAMQVNYPNDHDYTRIVEIKHATGQKLPVTTIVREYPGGLRRPAASRIIPSPRRTRVPSISNTPSARKRRAGRQFRRPAGDVSLLQHGPGGRHGAGGIRKNPREIHARLNPPRGKLISACRASWASRGRRAPCGAGATWRPRPPARCWCLDRRPLPPSSGAPRATCRG